MSTEHNPYNRLAERLDALPNGFPPTDDGSELRLLASIFSAEEADLAAQLRVNLETADEIARRLGTDHDSTRQTLKNMARKGLIRAGKAEGGLGYGLLPFVVGIYENQIGSFTKELAELFEQYYQQSFTKMLAIQPAIHRVVPVGESIKMDMQVAHMNQLQVSSKEPNHGACRIAYADCKLPTSGNLANILWICV